MLEPPEQQAFLQNPGVPANTPGIQSYIALVGSGSSLATTGKNPAFLQPQHWRQQLRDLRTAGWNDVHPWSGDPRLIRSTQ